MTGGTPLIQPELLPGVGPMSKRFGALALDHLIQVTEVFDVCQALHTLSKCRNPGIKYGKGKLGLGRPLWWLIDDATPKILPDPLLHIPESVFRPVENTWWVSTTRRGFPTVKKR